MKLDVAGIERIRSVQASGTDGASRIADAYRQYLVAYAARYLAHGDSALLEYRDPTSPRRRPRGRASSTSIARVSTP
ncbi:MAG: hypothetical protein DMF84_21665 [Acidobacteria bacterium]|nr:MAG: hypothetical protein DMF84_21665 [Acidobacteriota bacterium]